jgi:ubiquinone biosynthesis protein
MPLDFLRLHRTYKTARRLQQVINVFLRHGFGRVIDQIHLGRYIPFRKRIRAFGQWPALKGPSVPERLRMAFAELGPSFIKLAQLLSTRPDLITARYAQEFRKLQDEVPAFEPRVAKDIIEQETGMPLGSIFREFEEVPSAAASIAQVHRAVLADGSRVVVKVQRPGIREQLEADLDILETVAELMERHISESAVFNPSGIVEEFRRTVTREMDFLEEARNCRQFRRNFEDHPHVYFPRVHEEFSTSRILVMERLEGVRIDDVKGIETLGLDRKDLARKGVDAYLKMVFEDGFFHADPHPGNIFALPTGQVGYTDFGIVGRVSEEMKQTLINTFLAVARRDYDRLIEHYIDLGYVPEDVDLDVFRHEFRDDLVYLMEPVYGLTLKEIRFAEYLENLIQLAMKHRMRTPAQLLLINKAIIILEDVGSRLDPDFNFMEAAEPYAARLMKEKTSPGRVVDRLVKEMGEAGDFVTVFPKQMKKLVRKALRDDLHMKMTLFGMDDFIKDMDRSTNRIAFAMVVSAVLLSSAIMHATGVGPTIHGMSVMGFLVFGFAAFLGIWLVISIIRSGRL